MPQFIYTMKNLRKVTPQGKEILKKYGVAVPRDARRSLARGWLWLGVLASTDPVFLTLALWTFEPLMTD